MNCEEAQLAFASHLDGEALSGDDAAALDVHLVECPACRTRATELATTHRDLLRLRVTEATSPKRAPVAPREERKPSAVQPTEPAHRHSFWIEAAAAVLLAAVLALLLWPKGKPTEDVPHSREIAQTPLPAHSRIGQVAATQGRVEGKADHAATPLALKPGAELLAGQEIHVEQDGFAELEVDGGIRVRLEPVSVLRFGGQEEPGRVLLMTGKGRFEVTARNAPWRLQTPNASVETSGGVFVVTVQVDPSTRSMTRSILRKGANDE